MHEGRDGSRPLTKRCPRCGEEKPRSEFSKSAKSSDGLQGYCTPCFREYNYQIKYGISTAQYEQMLVNSGGVCEICRKSCRRRLNVDHDHGSGAVRGLLCDNCNRALGYFRDDPEILRVATKYLETKKCPY